jgi:hypothetical protein
VHQVLLALLVEGVRARQLVQLAEHLLEVPRVAEVHLAQAHLRLRGDSLHVGGQVGRGLVVAPVVQQLEAVHQQVVVLAEGHAGAPALPALVAAPPRVEGGAVVTEHDSLHG